MLRKEFSVIEELNNLYDVCDNWKQLLLDSFVLIVTFALPPYCDHLCGIELDQENVNAAESMELVRNCISVDVSSLC